MLPEKAAAAAAFRNALPSGRILQYVGGIQGIYNMENEGEAVAAGTQHKEKTLLWNKYGESSYASEMF